MDNIFLYNVSAKKIYADIRDIIYGNNITDVGLRTFSQWCVRSTVILINRHREAIARRSQPTSIIVNYPYMVYQDPIELCKSFNLQDLAFNTMIELQVYAISKTIMVEKYGECVPLETTDEWNQISSSPLRIIIADETLRFLCDHCME